jgi:putrescine aminotransferase
LEEAILELGENRVAAFIAEPIQGAGGVIVPPETYWPEIQRICDKYGILLIADEVITGFGRLGHWFGSQSYAIRPHIMTIAKGLSSGYQPIGGSIVCDEVANTIAQDEFNHGYTYSGHPVAAAVALENLRILEEEGIVTRVRDTTAPYLSRAWARLSNHPLVGEAVSRGMMASLALTPDKARRACFAADPGTVGYICREYSFENNLVMRHVGDRMIIAPPLVISHSDIDEIIQRALRALDQTLARLHSDGLMSAA